MLNNAERGKRSGTPSPRVAQGGGAALLVKQEQLNDIYRDVRSIHTMASNLLVLINDTLDLAKIEANTLQLEIGHVSVPVVLQQAVQAVAQAASAKGVLIQIDCDPMHPAMVGSPFRLQQVLFQPYAMT